MGSPTHWPLRLFAIALGLAAVVAVPTRRLDSADPPADPPPPTLPSEDEP